MKKYLLFIFTSVLLAAVVFVLFENVTRVVGGSRSLFALVGTAGTTDEEMVSAVERLVELGHRRIAFLGGYADSVVRGERLEGFGAAFAAATLAYWSEAPVRILGEVLPVDGPFGDFSDEEGFRAQARRSAGEYGVPERLLELGRRNDVKLPARTVRGLERFCRFSGFDRFIAVWVRTTSVLRHRRDFHQVVVDYAAELAKKARIERNPVYLDAIAAVFIGGASMSGGVGKIMGVVVGALIMGVMNNGMSILGVNIDWQQVIKGMVPDPYSRLKGCPFHPRCPVALDVCKAEMPPLYNTAPGQRVACWLARG